MAKWNKRHRLLVRWSLVSGAIILVSVGITLFTQATDEQAVLPGDKVDGLTSVLSPQKARKASPIRLVDVTDQVNVRFHHFSTTRASLLPEDMGSGVAVGDYDGDGFADLFFVDFSKSILPRDVPGQEVGACKLYRNIEGTHFEDVTDRAGVGWVGLGMAAAWGDYDSDGDLDLYVTSYGPNVLYRNNGDGTFQDVSRSSQVHDTRFSAGCSWGDYDRDGHLDLYVTNYVDFVYHERDRSASRRQYTTEQPYTINPSAYKPQANALFHNNGDGTFTDVASRAGIDNPTGRSLSASWVDFNNDGHPDLYVANDVSNNGVFLNNGDGTFSDIGPGSLAADYRGAMGIAVADFDGDLDLDLVITHWLAQENALYRNMTLDNMLGPDPDGKVWFMDTADEYGLGQISLDMVGWATGFVDFDNDGALDLWLVNGSTLELAEDHRQLETQPPFLFWNSGGGHFVEVGGQVSPFFQQPTVGRGGAQFDFDNDGRVELVLVRHGGEAVLLRNETDRSGHWLRLSLRQERGNTYALGARAYVTSGDLTQLAQVGAGSSYLSQHEHTLHFGLGDHDRVDGIRIIWPDGHEETLKDVAVDQTWRITRAEDGQTTVRTTPVP